MPAFSQEEEDPKEDPNPRCGGYASRPQGVSNGKPPCFMFPSAGSHLAGPVPCRPPQPQDRPPGTPIPGVCPTPDFVSSCGCVVEKCPKKQPVDPIATGAVKGTGCQQPQHPQSGCLHGVSPLAMAAKRARRHHSVWGLRQSPRPCGVKALP